MKDIKKRHKTDILRNPITTEITYKKAIEFALKAMKAKITDKKIPMTQFCREHNINYQILLNIKNNGKGQYPSVIAKLLETLGYKITIKKKIQYKYTIRRIANKQVAAKK